MAVVGALALVGLALALQLQPSTSTDALVGKGSEAAKATDRFHRQFGDESIVILVRGRLKSTVLTSDLARLIGLGGCLSGNVPPGDQAVLRRMPKPCQQFAREKPVKVVYGPGTFINQAANQINQGFAAQRAAAAAQG